MDESKNLLTALEKMLAMKTAVVTDSLEPTPSTSGLSTSSARKRLHVADQTSSSKKPRLEPSVKKSVGNTFASIPIRVTQDIDMNEFLAQAKGEILQKISEELNERNALKFYLNVTTQLSRTSTDGEEQITTPYFCSIPKIILHSTDIGSEIDIAGERVKELLATHEGQGSGFKLDTILDCQLHVANYDRIGVPVTFRCQNMCRTRKLQLISKILMTRIVSSTRCFTQSCNQKITQIEYTIIKNISVNWTCRELGHRSK